MIGQRIVNGVWLMLIGECFLVIGELEMVIG
jgi:hypothetical protein